MRETLHIVDGRTALRMERRLTHPPEKIWRALTEPGRISSWFPSDVDLDLRPGGRISFVFRQNEGPALDGVITELDPPRVIAYSWGQDLLRWEVRPDGDGSLLVLVHTFDDHAGAASYAAGWNACVAAIDPALDGRPAPAPGDMAEAHERYIASLGLAAGTAEDLPEGWKVRYERQLTRPADTVWATLLGAPGTPPVGAAVPSPLTAGEFPPGTVTAADAPALLEYDWHSPPGPGGLVRWELRPGTGHGARLVLTQTGPAEAPELGDTALDIWGDRIEQLARTLAGLPD